MAKDHGSSVKNDKQYEGLRKKGMSKSRAAAIANSPGASSRGGKSSGSSKSSRSSGSGSGATSPRRRPPAEKAARSRANPERSPALCADPLERADVLGAHGGEAVVFQNVADLVFAEHIGSAVR